MTNWKAINHSDIWNEEIRPWLTELRQDALEDMARAKDVDEYRYWQGYCKALAVAVEMPQEMIEAERLIAEQEKTDIGSANNARRDWVRNARRAIGFGG